MANKADSNVDTDHPEFDNDSRWPRRLLHVPSMTSYKWEPGNRYGRHSQPDYVALSYTWGRYMVKDDEFSHVKPLKIRGVSWSIPRVNPDTHFSVAEFQHIIWEVMKEPDRVYTFDSWKWDTMRNQSLKNRILRTVLGFLENRVRVYEFLWLDIACIDQRWTATTMKEIGRQARIFRHAKHSYAWLSHLPYGTLEPLLVNLEQAVWSLQKEPFHQEASAFDTRPWILAALTAISGLTADPWFSSLWTLQEAFLCNHAVILSRDGKVTCDASLVRPRSWSLNYLFKLTNDIVFWSESTLIPRVEPEYSQLIDLVHTSGLAALWYNTPMALLGVSYNRRTTRELDRVYGVMQVFGDDFRVGLSREGADRNRIYTLPELEDEFGAAIIQFFPVLSQMHVHLAPPAVGKGWCVRGNSAVPYIAERGDFFGWDGGDRIDVNIDIGCETSCEFSTRLVQGNTWGYLAGRISPFIVLQRAWKEADASSFAKTLLTSGWRMHRSSIPSIHMIALDRGTEFKAQSPELNVLNVVGLKDEERQHQLAASIVQQSESYNLKVFLLAKCHFGDQVFNTALLLLKQENDNLCYWRRIGICMWSTSHLVKDGLQHPLGPFLRGESDEWHHTEGLFG